MAVSREAVFWGFRLILGHDPEGEPGIQAHCDLADEYALIEVLLRSREFRDSGRFSNVVTLQEPTEEPAAKSWKQWAKSRMKAMLGVDAWRPPEPPPPHSATSSARIVLFGNCQITSIARLLQAMTGDAGVKTVETTPSMLARLRSGEFDMAPLLQRSDLVFVQWVGEVTDFVRERFPDQVHKLRQFPPVAYAGFHPDCVYARAGAVNLSGPLGEYHSAIALWAWRHGLDVDAAVDLFRGEVFDALGYPEYMEASHKALLELGLACGFPMAMLTDRWRSLGCWMHTINHPKITVLADIAREMLRREGIQALPGAEAWVEDPLLLWPVWPVYPELAARLGMPGDYTFKLDRGLCPPQQSVLALDLTAFVRESFESFRHAGDGPIECPRIDSAPYARLASFVRQRRLPTVAADAAAARVTAEAAAAPAAPPVPDNPYAALPDQAFWRRAVARVPQSDLAPVVPGRRVMIAPTHRIATAGSCFAQHIARTLRRHGYGHFVVDDNPALPEAERERRGFGVYSARFGNVYTARQLLQLFDRAFGEFTATETAWQRPDGRFVDPFRPQIEPDGFDSPEAVRDAQREHLLLVRHMFLELDIFVFTLGLTEAWRAVPGGDVFPLAPGVVAGRFDASRHEFVNFGAAEVENDLRGFASRLRAVNPRARIVLTVSPVPLIATYGSEHVLSATAYSKAVLRAAAGAVARAFNFVDYFPSFEIITSSHSRGQYFEDDLRSVTEAGVAHVMRVFLAHHAGSGDASPAGPPVPVVDSAAVLQEQRLLQSVVCDEEAIERHRS